MMIDPNLAWRLCLVEPGAPGEGPKLTMQRELDDGEYELFAVASSRLRQMNLPALFSVVAAAFDAMQVAFKREIARGPAALSEPAVMAVLKYQLTAALAAFSYFRADLEHLADELRLPALERIRTDFANAQATDRQWALIWQLRNIDQHHPSAVRHVTVSSDRLTGEVSWMVDVDRLIKYARDVTDKKHFLRGWDRLETLWADQDRQVDLDKAIDHAMAINLGVLTDALLTVEDELAEAIWQYLAVTKSLIGDGGAAVVRSARDGDPPRVINLNFEAVDPRVPGLVAASINHARKVRGRPARFDLTQTAGSMTVVDLGSD